LLRARTPVFGGFRLLYCGCTPGWHCPLSAVLLFFACPTTLRILLLKYLTRKAAEKDAR
jgi:hypothetical protein